MYNTNIITKKRFSSIDFLRFVFCMLIVGYHYYDHYLKTYGFQHFFCRAYLGDEFFFMVSGYFLAKQAFSIDGTNGSFTFDSIVHRIKKIAIPYYITWVFCIFGSCITAAYLHTPEPPLFLKFTNSIYELLFLDMFGFCKGTYVNGVSWFFSALIIGIAIVSPVLSAKEEKYALIGAPLVALSIYAYLSQNYDYLWGPHSLLPGLPVYKGLVRAFAGINLGIFIAGIVMKSKIKWNRFMLVPEIILWSGIIVYSIFPFKDNFVSVDIQYDSIVTLWIFLALLIGFCREEKTAQKGSIVEKASVHLGSISMYVFTAQAVLYSIDKLLNEFKFGPFTMLLLYFGGVIIIALGERIIDIKLRNTIGRIRLLYGK